MTAPPSLCRLISCFHDPMVVLLDLSPVCHAPSHTSQSSNLYNFLVPTEEHAHSRAATLIRCPRPSTPNLRESGTLWSEFACGGGRRGLRGHALVSTITTMSA
jgi:hypothetical protein